MKNLFRIAAILVAAVIATPAVARDSQVAQAQLLLKMLGQYAGPIDGSYGGKVQNSLNNFYAKRGGSYDGTLSANEFDDIYAALEAVPFNGSGDIKWISAADYRTSGNPKFDFAPKVDFAALLPTLKSIPPDALAERVAALPRGVKSEVCSYQTSKTFPPPGQLHTYPSDAAFNAGNRWPDLRNKWLEDFSFVAEGAAAGIDSGRAVREFKEALLEYARAGAALDSADLVDKAGMAIVNADFANGIWATASITASYLIARPRLKLSDAERAEVEQWLDRLYETYPDSYIALNGTGNIREPHGLEMVGRAMMLNGILDGNVDKFNQGAKLFATFLSFMREDGSDRFGASRGFRALYYSGSELMVAMEGLIILNAYMPETFEILRPTVDKRAEFWGRAWNDHSVLFPYAKENASEPQNQNYKQQEARDQSSGLDPYLEISGDKPYFDDLLKIRAAYPYPRMYGATFNETCLGLTLPGAALPGAPPPPPPPAALTVAGAYVTSVEQIDDGAGADLKLLIAGATLDGKPVSIPQVDILLDWPKGKPEQLSLFRLTFVAADQQDPQTRAADFSSCKDVSWAKWPDGTIVFRLALGSDASSNQCVLDKLGANDRKKFEALSDEFDKVIAVMGKDHGSDVLREAFARVP